MIRTVCFCVTAVAMTLLPSVCSAQSLWQRRDPSKVFLFYDTEARFVGDLITILIQENTGVDNKEDRNLKKDTESKGMFDYKGSTNSPSGSASADASLNSTLTSNRKFDGSTKFTSDRRFTDRVTVLVLDIQPNGNLVIGGKRQVIVAGDVRTLVVSGVVRPIDIKPDNSVASQFIANFHMDYEGVGVEPAFVNQGLLGRLGNRLWPF